MRVYWVIARLLKKNGDLTRNFYSIFCETREQAEKTLGLYNNGDWDRNHLPFIIIETERKSRKDFVWDKRPSQKVKDEYDRRMGL